MLWLPLAIGSYFLSALSSTVDKILLKERIPRPAVYAFYSGILSAGILVLLPFYIVQGLLAGDSLGGALHALILPSHTALLAIFAGLWFVPALYFFYSALKRCDVSRIVPIIGGAVPIILLLFSYIFEGAGPSLYQLLAILFFISGGFILATEVMCEECVDSLGTHLLGIRGHRLQICGVDTGKGIFAALLAAFCFAATFFFSTLVYHAPTPFLPEFAWMRIGSALGALCMLSIPWLRREVSVASQSMTSSSGGYLVGNKIIGAVGFLLLNKSFDIGPVIVINALKGFEYLFIFLFSIGFTLFAPEALREVFDRHTIILKLTAIVLLSFGFLFLVSA